MNNQADLNDDENWAGGSYELAIELGPRDDTRLEQALAAMWRHASVAGCFAADYHPHSPYRPLRLDGHTAVALNLRSLEEHTGGLRGVTSLPSGVDIICGVIAVREENGPDWLDFYLPWGALARTDPRIGGFPFGDDHGPVTFAWRRPIDRWLASVGSSVFADVPFRLGLIGHIVSGAVHADGLTADASGRRDIGYLLPEQGSLRYREPDE
jgi:hypothetical protein